MKSQLLERHRTRKYRYCLYSDWIAYTDSDFIYLIDRQHGKNNQN